MLWSWGDVFMPLLVINSSKSELVKQVALPVTHWSGKPCSANVQRNFPLVALEVTVFIVCTSYHLEYVSTMIRNIFPSQSPHNPNEYQTIVSLWNMVRWCLDLLYQAILTERKSIHWTSLGPDKSIVLCFLHPLVMSLINWSTSALQVPSL